MHWTPVGPDTYLLGESPFWQPQEQTLYWVDIPGKKILRANVFLGTVQTWDMPSEPGCIAPALNGGLVVALRHGVFRAPQWGGELIPLVTLPYDAEVVRANDGKCDALGRFWVGTIDETKASRAAALFSVDCRHSPPIVTRHAQDALTGNGLAWGLDSQTLYWADTPEHTIYAWDYDLHDNVAARRRVFKRFAPRQDGWTYQDTSYQGRPDGAAVDAQGNYYVAMFEGRRICKFAPDGRLLSEMATPAQCPTMPCFGGEDLKTLYVTTASYNRSATELVDFPQSGAVFSTRVDVPGLPVNFFAG